MKKLFLALVALAALWSLPAAAQTACGSFPYTFANGSIGFADQVNANFAATANCQPGIDPRAPPYNATFNGTTDDTAAINAAITAVCTANTAGANSRPSLLLPAGTTAIAGTITIPCSNFSFVGMALGATTIHCTGAGTASCLIVGGVPGTPVSNVEVGRFRITVDGRTGGEAIDVWGCSNCYVHDIYSASVWNGIWYQAINAVSQERVQFQGVRSTSNTGFCISFYTPAASGFRSDVLNIGESTCNGGYAGNSGLIWDGASFTLTTRQTNILHTTIAYWVRNTAVSTTLFPQEWAAIHTQADGVSGDALEIDSGWNMTFSDNSVFSNTSGSAGQGGADGPACMINPDLSGAVTRMIRFVGARCENTQQQAAFINARDLKASSAFFTDASKAGSGMYPAVEIGANAHDVTISGSKLGPVFGNAVLTNYGVIVDAGAQTIVLSADDFNSNITGSYLDHTNNAEILGGVSNTATPLGLYIPSNAPNVGLYYGFPNPGGENEVRVFNSGTTTGTISQMSMVTGTVNAFMDCKEIDGATPTAQCDIGQGNTALNYNFNNIPAHFNGLPLTPTGKQPLCIDNSTAQVYRGTGGAC
jgi:hypothetical protein